MATTQTCPECPRIGTPRARIRNSPDISLLWRTSSDSVRDPHAFRRSALRPRKVHKVQIPPPIFDPAYYLQANPDLRAAFGPTGYDAAAAHFAARGLAQECRRGAPDFDAGWYLARNPDVNSACGGRCTCAAAHWLEFGRAEGRPGAPAAVASAEPAPPTPPTPSPTPAPAPTAQPAPSPPPAPAAQDVPPEAPIASDADDACAHADAKLGQACGNPLPGASGADAFGCPTAIDIYAGLTFDDGVRAIDSWNLKTWGGCLERAANLDAAIDHIRGQTIRKLNGDSRVQASCQ